ncbi:StaA [uncultured Sulfitobacter sp.]|jgi:DNA-damage-inducible protein J
MAADHDTYLVWFRASVREAQDDPRPAIPHAQVMEAAQMLIDEKRRSRSS